MLKRIIVMGGVVLLMLALLVGGVWWYIGNLKSQPALENDVQRHVLGQQEVIALTKPAVVRIVQHAKGTAIIPNFDLDLQARKIQELPGESRIPFDQYYSGSGFIVRPDGYIVTNSHVVSRQTVQLEAISKAIMTVVAVKVQDIMAHPEKYQWAKEMNLGNQEQFQKFGEDIAEHLLAKTTFEFDEKKVVVLNPSAPGDTPFSDLVRDGFPAKMVSVNDSFFRDDKDAALIKIDQDNLPTLKINDETTMSTGNRVYAFGFPATADTGTKNFLEATFTSGTVSALKDAEKGTFKIIQTDAKVSHGSSGGPLLNEKGEVVGVITQQSADRSNGDAFAFAIPANIINATLTLSKIPGMEFPEKMNDTQWLDAILDGMALSDARHCARAIDRFEASGKVNSLFDSGDFVSSWVDACRGFSKNGESVDTRWDETRREIANMQAGTWWMIGAGGLLLMIGIGAIALLAVRSRKEQQEIDALKLALAHQEGLGAKEFTPQQPLQSVPLPTMSRPQPAMNQQSPSQPVAKSMNTSENISEPVRSSFSSEMSIPRPSAPFASSIQGQSAPPETQSPPMPSQSSDVSSPEKTVGSITFLN